MKSIFTLLLILGLLTVNGCGKYGPPVPPEALSPRPVQALTVSASAQGVKFTWSAPDSDQRGEELKSLDGYNVYRSEIDPLAAPADRNLADYQLIGTINDTHLAILQSLREQAIASGKPTRKIKVDSALKNFEFLDNKVGAKKVYLYKVVPFNQGSVEGQFNQFVKVLYNAEGSEITFPKNFIEESEAVF